MEVEESIVTDLLPPSCSVQPCSVLSPTKLAEIGQKCTSAAGRWWREHQVPRHLRLSLARDLALTASVEKSEQRLQAWLSESTLHTLCVLSAVMLKFGVGGELNEGRVSGTSVAVLSLTMLMLVLTSAA